MPIVSNLPRVVAPGEQTPSEAVRGYSFILREDPELADTLSEDDRRTAMELFRAPVIQVRSQRWSPLAIDTRTSFGLLVLDGLLGRRTHVGPGVATELIGVGDVLRPWEPSPWDLLEPDVDWRVFQPARLALLDTRITQLIGQRPGLIVAFSGRLVRRIRSAQYLMAVASLHRVEHRLLATLWHLASTWGRVTAGGVQIPFRLTHEVLSEIIGARRPSVTTALGALRTRNELAFDSRGSYILTGDPKDWIGVASLS